MNNAALLSIANLSTALLLAGLATASTACTSDVEAEEPNPLTDEVMQLQSRVQELEDLEGVRAVIECYGYGHDMIFFDLQGTRGEALSILRDCFAEDVETEVVFFGQPGPTLNSLEELVGFIADTAIQSGYIGARNNPGSVRIELTGTDTARLLSSTAAPHFTAPSANPDDPTIVDVFSARYVNEVERGEDGLWRTTKFSLLVDGYWRGTGVNPPMQ